MHLKKRVEAALKPKIQDGTGLPSEIYALIGDLWGEIENGRKRFEPTSDNSSINNQPFCVPTEAFSEVLDGIGLNYHQNILLIISMLGHFCNADFVTFNKLKDGHLINAGKWARFDEEIDNFNPIDRICDDLLKLEPSDIKMLKDLDKSTLYDADSNVALLKLKSVVGKAVLSQGILFGTLGVFFKEDIELNNNILVLIRLFASLLALEELRTLPLSDTEERIRILINATPDIICFKDGENRWLQANESMLGAFSLQNIDYKMKSESELAVLTAPVFGKALRRCMQSDDAAWEAGCLSRSEEGIVDANGLERIYDVIKVPLFNEDQSRKGLVVFGREITQRIKAQQQTAFLNQSALYFLQMEDNENIFEYIADRVYSLIGDGIVLSASFDESTQTATLRSLVGLGSLQDELLKMINRNPVGMTTCLNTEQKKGVLEQSLTHRKSLYEVLNGVLSEAECKTLEQLLNIGEIYEMGFASKDWLLGEVTMILPKGSELVNREAIEAFIKLSAVALYQKQVKLRLIESEESYRGLFNCMTNAVYIMDKEARFLDVNDGAVKMYGYPRERFIGNTPAFLSAPGKNDHINVIESLRKTFEGVPQQIEYWGVKKDGTVFPKDIKFYKGDYFGKTVVLAVADDITERFNMISQIISARDEAERNLKKTKSIVMAFPDLILVIDKEGNLLEAMSGNEDIAIFFAESENRKHISQLVPSHVLEVGIENMNKVLSTGCIQIFNIDVTYEGLKSYYEIRMVKYNDNQVLAVARDITRSIELINELNLEKNKAEESDRLKTAFLHNISHEIRTPLNGIVGFSNLLTQPGIAQGDTSEYVSYINSCSDQLLAIINDIVSVATLEAGQEKLLESSVDLNKMMNRVLSQFLTKANEKGLEIEFKTGLPDEKCLIVADETKLIQVLSNLVGNSVKFTTAGNVEFGYVDKSEFIEFYVKDSGIGIPENMHEAIFDRFRQVNNTLSLNTGGTGLGLSISKSYIELMGGRIWLKSIPGRQTVFFFTIPKKSSTGDYSAPMDSPVIQKRTYLQDRVILVAEDEEINFKLIKGMLGSFGVKLIHVFNGADAVELCKTNETIDLVLMDLKMNVMDGFTAAGHIRNIRPELPIIAQSALALVGDRHRAIDAGCTDYISKPLRKVNLIALLEKYLKR